MSALEFIKDLPLENPKNFSKFSTGMSRPQKRPSIYITAEDNRCEQQVVMDKHCVLLRYLKQQWDKKTLPRKRDHPTSAGPGGGNSSGSSHSSKKRIRLEPLDLN